jgi:hypothetical protein
MTVQKNARTYWQYAIKSTIYYIKKAKKESHLRVKRQHEMLELSQLYYMTQLN